MKTILLLGLLAAIGVVVSGRQRRSAPCETDVTICENAAIKTALNDQAFCCAEGFTGITLGFEQNSETGNSEPSCRCLRPRNTDGAQEGRTRRKGRMFRRLRNWMRKGGNGKGPGGMDMDEMRQRFREQQETFNRLEQV